MKPDTARNIIICPSCGAQNVEGTEECVECTADLRAIDVPETSQPEPRHILLTPLTQFAHWDAGAKGDGTDQVDLLATAAGAASDGRTRTSGTAVLKDSDDVGSALYRMSTDRALFVPVRSGNGQVGYVRAIEVLDWLRQEQPGDRLFNEQLATVARSPEAAANATSGAEVMSRDATIGEAVAALAERHTDTISLTGANGTNDVVTAVDLVVAYAETHAEMTLNLSPDPNQLIPAEDGG